MKSPAMALDDGDFRSAFANTYGARGCVTEVHALCEEKKIMLKFSKDDERREPTSLRSSTGKKVLKLAVVVRDALLLSADTFLHLFWKLSKRVELKSLTFTQKLHVKATRRKEELMQGSSH